MGEEELDHTIELSPVTKKVVDRLIEWKKRREKWKKIKFVFDCLALVFMVAIISYIYLQLGKINDLPQFYSTLFSPAVEKGFIILIPILIVWKFASSKYKDVDDDYETLRKEIIDRADELWYHHPKDWSNRQEALKFIDKKYGVNLFYKKK